MEVPLDSPGLEVLPDLRHVTVTVNGSQYRVDVADVTALPDIRQVDIDLGSSGTARVAAADVITLPDITWLTLAPDGGGTLIRVDEANTRQGALTFASTSSAPLFNTRGAPVQVDDIKQTTLGDCYLQAVMMAIARNDPNYFPQMMQATGGDTVTVRFYESTGGTPNPVYIKVDKTLPQTAPGQALYNAGAIWARLLQKAFVVFAGLYGQYGGAYAAPRALKGYPDIAGGVERMVYGVFYGPALASASTKPSTTIRVHRTPTTCWPTSTSSGRWCNTRVNAPTPASRCRSSRPARP